MKKMRLVFSVSAFLLAGVGVFTTVEASEDLVINRSIKPNASEAGPCSVSVSSNCELVAGTPCTFSGQASNGLNYTDKPVYDQSTVDCPRLSFP